MSTRVLREPIIVTASLHRRFFSKTVDASSGCMIWTGAVQRNGYGAFKADGSKHDAHVFAWRLSHDGQPVPVGQLVMHTCDCRVCVNPNHLILGTQHENMKHAHADGRGSDFHCRGEDRPDAVLTEPLVRAIRHIYKPNIVGYRRVAEILGIHPDLVRNVVFNRTWAHVSDANRHPGVMP